MSALSEFTYCSADTPEVQVLSKQVDSKLGDAVASGISPNGFFMATLAQCYFLKGLDAEQCIPRAREKFHAHPGSEVDLIAVALHAYGLNVDEVLVDHSLPVALKPLVVTAPPALEEEGYLTDDEFGDHPMANKVMSAQQDVEKPDTSNPIPSMALPAEKIEKPDPNPIPITTLLAEMPSSWQDALAGLWLAPAPTQEDFKAKLQARLAEQLGKQQKSQVSKMMLSISVQQVLHETGLDALKHAWETVVGHNARNQRKSKKSKLDHSQKYHSRQRSR